MRISDWSSDVCSSDLFRSHIGIDPIGVLRSVKLMIENWGTDRRIQGASTITQQVARTIFLSNKYTRSEERRVGKSVSVRVDLGGRRIIKKKKIKQAKDTK